MSPSFNPAALSNPTPATILEPIIKAVLPGWVFLHGTLDQLNIQFDDLPANGRAVALNDLIPITLQTTNTGHSTLAFSPSLLFCVKADTDDSPDVRDGYCREALAAARALLYRLQKDSNNLKVVGNAEGATFLALYDAELDGAEFAYRLELALDKFDYCAVPIPLS